MNPGMFEYEDVVDFMKYILELPEDTMPVNEKLKMAEKIFGVRCYDVSDAIDKMLEYTWMYKDLKR